MDEVMVLKATFNDKIINTTFLSRMESPETQAVLGTDTTRLQQMIHTKKTTFRIYKLSCDSMFRKLFIVYLHSHQNYYGLFYINTSKR